MSFVEILLLALALSADAFTVGAAVGLGHCAARQIFRLSFHFGLFQSIMSLAGALAGTFLIVYMKDFDHWIAFGLLAFVGGKMIYESFKQDEDAKRSDPTCGLSLVGLSLAVSIDALAAGIGLAAAKAPLFLAVATIGAVSSAATLVAMLLAGRIPANAAKRAELVAGLILIALGTKILWDHMGASAIS
ncbi:MAG: manganese efflux pump MntP family protein [Deltaproteobacteria bacterium]|nr:manganese efflux pump MntP family protein [Deltaproteobacteria bacterium]